MKHEPRTFHLYLSHTWCHGDALDTLTRFLDRERTFKWSSEIIGLTDPLNAAKNEVPLNHAIADRLAKADCLLVLAGVDDTHRYWLEKEIRFAKKLGKPMVAVQPWAANKTSRELHAAAWRIVDWNGRAIVQGIREGCAREKPTRDARGK